MHITMHKKVKSAKKRLEILSWCLRKVAKAVRFFPSSDCNGVTRCYALGSGPTNWSVFPRCPFCYRTHTSFGGRWCHRGTCLPHSHPLSAAQIYLHSRLFSRDPSCNQRGAACLFVVAGARDCWQTNMYSLKDHVYFPSVMLQLIFIPS